MHDDREGVGVPYFDRGKRNPQIERKKISAADFSRLLFFSALSPGAEMSQLGRFMFAAGQDFDEQVKVS
jgi:hypothetical protein